MPVFTIDDERPALETLNNAVREAIPGAEIRAFRRAAEALDYMEQHGVKPEIVFSDIRMPGIDGLVLAVRIKTLSPETRIVFCDSLFGLRAEGVSGTRKRLSGKAGQRRSDFGGAEICFARHKRHGQQTARSVLRQFRGILERKTCIVQKAQI